jgi:hypothetical protein
LLRHANTAQSCKFIGPLLLIFCLLLLQSFLLPSLNLLASLLVRVSCGLAQRAQQAPEQALAALLLLLHCRFAPLVGIAGSVGLGLVVAGCFGSTIDIFIIASCAFSNAVFGID